MDVIRSMSGIPQSHQIVTSELVGSHDCFLVPIREVQVVIHDGHGKYDDDDSGSNFLCGVRFNLL